ncbi:FMN-binding protein [Lentzea flaviverrucosa]|uniref:FMN-binding domain-containing protein n=1 Tax=Lentzea flaviverrucosa TaxID=200379 RepID=A0A1H9X6A1_9PSEU|nr:FMN-binding protein [Lentzea flaviverrucosa]RDI20814.1 FMN-binding protein [Lentzea flaviverrucosa]SES41397.1 FMN-binding domain-containing protein [Lentzea flaviverrucosa]
MKRAIPVLALSVAGLVPVWIYSPGAAHEGELSEVAAPPAQEQTQQQAAPQTTAPKATGAAPKTTGAAPKTTQQQQTTQQQAQNRSVSGPAVNTSEGTVQVQVTLQGTKIVDVKALRAPNSNPTRMALPLLRESALKAQSADIDTVSGATATSEGYKQSLQAAIDGAQ